MARKIRRVLVHAIHRRLYGLVGGGWRCGHVGLGEHKRPLAEVDVQDCIAARPHARIVLAPHLLGGEGSIQLLAILGKKISLLVQAKATTDDVTHTKTTHHVGMAPVGSGVIV